MLAFDLAEGDAMTDAVVTGYENSVLGRDDSSGGSPEAAKIVVVEMESFVAAVSVHAAEEKAGTARPGAGGALVRSLKTVLGSVGEIFEMSKFGKGVLTVVKEGLELWGG